MLLVFSISSALGYSRLNGQRRDNPRFWVLVPGRSISAYPKHTSAAWREEHLKQNRSDIEVSISQPTCQKYSPGGDFKQDVLKNNSIGI